MYASVEASVINLFQLIHFGHKIILGGVQLRATLYHSTCDQFIIARLYSLLSSSSLYLKLAVN